MSYFTAFYLFRNVNILYSDSITVQFTPEVELLHYLSICNPDLFY